MSDTTLVRVIAENTQAITAMNGSLWIFAGYISILVAGLICIKYTFKGR